MLYLKSSLEFINIDAYEGRKGWKDNREKVLGQLEMRQNLSKVCDCHV